MNPENHEKRRDHEHSDWDLRYVVYGAVSLALSLVLMLAGSWWIFKKFDSDAASRQTGTVTGPSVAPPEPRLQVSPRADWSGMLRKEQATLNSYGWVDRARGVVRIPIDREMQLIAERGFPAAKAQRGNAK